MILCAGIVSPASPGKFVQFQDLPDLSRVCQQHTTQALFRVEQSTHKDGAVRHIQPLDTTSIWHETLSLSHGSKEMNEAGKVENNIRIVSIRSLYESTLSSHHKREPRVSTSSREPKLGRFQRCFPLQLLNCTCLLDSIERESGRRISARDYHVRCELCPLKSERVQHKFL